MHQRIICLVTLAVGMLFIAQALLVPIYVPMLFDNKWNTMIPVVSIICLVALPSIMVDSYCSFERAKANYNREIVTRFVCLTISLALLFICSPTQPMDFAMVLFFSSLLWCAVIYFGHKFICIAAHHLAFFTWRKSHEYSAGI